MSDGFLSRIASQVRHGPHNASAPQSDIPSFSEGWLSRIIQEQDEVPEPSRITEEFIHVSSLLDFCPRRSRIAAVEGRTVVKSVRSGDRVVWALGRAIEAHVRRQLIAAHRNAVYGRWRCSCGSLKVTGFYSDEVCNCCNETALHYEELPLFDNELKVVGNPDLYIFLEGKFVIVEIKSINKKDFEKLTRPQGNHTFQLGCYVKMAEKESQLPFPVADQHVVFYVCKDYMWKTPYKEYAISRTHNRGLINSIWGDVENYRALESVDRVGPRLDLCDCATAPKASNCSLCTSCFNRSEDG